MVIAEIFAREGGVGMPGFVEHWDVRLDPVLIDQPIQHFSLTDRRRRFDIDMIALSVSIS